MGCFAHCVGLSCWAWCGPSELRMHAVRVADSDGGRPSGSQDAADRVARLELVLPQLLPFLGSAPKVAGGTQLVRIQFDARERLAILAKAQLSRAAAVALPDVPRRARSARTRCGPRRGGGGACPRAASPVRRCVGVARRESPTGCAQGVFGAPAVGRVGSPTRCRRGPGVFRARSLPSAFRP